jgi:hypothetical protein
MNEPNATARDKPLVSVRTRLAIWISVIVISIMTFVAYDQVALALQWVVMKLC